MDRFRRAASLQHGWTRSADFLRGAAPRRHSAPSPKVLGLNGRGGGGGGVGGGYIILPPGFFIVYNMVFYCCYSIYNVSMEHLFCM